MVLFRRLFLSALLWLPLAAHAFEPFVVKDIRVEGLQRIAAGTVFNYLPVKRGDLLDEKLSSEAVRTLFKTGFFKDVVLEREDGTLVVFVAERPAIASVKVEGNSKIEKDILEFSFKQVGLVEGRVFDSSLLDRMEQELKRQYLLLGMYAAQVKTTVTPQERNRVAIDIAIAEGEVATIQSINIVGNVAFSEADLLSRMQSEVKPPIASPFFSADEYSRPKLTGDLEALRSFYLDRGYINFSIDSTQVSITPDKKDIYITINITEGTQYRISGIKVAGETIVPEQEIRDMVALEPGDIFSRKVVTESSTRISDRLGEVGYAFANINPIPDVNEEKREVGLTFFVDPGKRVYVRRINLTGNLRTKDEVLRREIRQMEGAPLEAALVNRSRTRLDRLGYFNGVSVETSPVPGQPDQVDVTFHTEERETFGSFNAGVGYGDVQGFLVNVSITQENFMGSGNRFTIAANNSESADEYSFSYTNPYYTLDGVSRGFDVYYRTANPDSVLGTGYSTDSFGGGVNYSMPLSEFNTFRYGLTLDRTKINTTSSTSQSIVDFCSKESDVADECAFNSVRANLSWSIDSRDRTLFATNGTYQVISTDVALPAGPTAINFYKLTYRVRDYTPLGKSGYFVQLGGEANYGSAYGATSELPPFERFYAGGSRSVRGYAAYSLGPRDANDKALGGNARLLGNSELILPNPFSENSNSVRVSVFLEGGNVFETSSGISTQDLRFSTGLALYWFTPIGPLSFSFAHPLNAAAGDETEQFQFTLGTPF